MLIYPLDGFCGAKLQVFDLAASSSTAVLEPRKQVRQKGLEDMENLSVKHGYINRHRCYTYVHITVRIYIYTYTYLSIYKYIYMHMHTYLFCIIIYVYQYTYVPYVRLCLHKCSISRSTHERSVMLIRELILKDPGWATRSYECASSLVTLSSSPVAIHQAAQAWKTWDNF